VASPRNRQERFNWSNTPENAKELRRSMNYTEPWKKDGYLIVRGAFDAARIRRLHECCEPAFEQWKRESTKDNQPFGYGYGPTAWTLIHLNHPAYYREHPERLAVLLDAVADPLALRILADLFREEAVMMQINYYIDPPGETRIGGWHRDCQFYPGADEEAQKRVVAEEADPPRELHMHIPLVPTQATEVVPGSHNRWDTAEEHHIRKNDASSDNMPGRKIIQLQPGDLAFFHVNSLHRGMYIQGVPRRTIAVTFGRAAHPRKATAEMMKTWRGYVATYQPWFLKPGYLDGCAPATQEFFRRFIEVYRDSWKPEYLDPLNPELKEFFTRF
jgi:hypothetical protein